MNKKGLLLILSTALISGISVFINKYGVAMNNPYIFAFLKNALVAILLTSLILAIKEYASLRALKLKQWGILAVIGIIGGGIPFLFFFKGLSLTSAAQGSFIQKTMFLYVALLAIIFLKEKLSKGFWAGAILLLGANLLILKSFNFSFGQGDLLIFCATLFWAVENIISKYTLKNLSGNVVAWGRMFFGSILIAGFLLFTGQTSAILTIGLPQVGWIGITSLLLLGYTLTWYNGLKHIPVSVATAILMAGFPITTLLSALSSGKLITKDVYSGIIIAGALVLIIGANGLWERAKNYVRT
jgi:drug/metabolite transporter (DMT)-like permease